MKKTNTKYLDIATKFILDVCKDDLSQSANIIYAQADGDYNEIYNTLHTIIEDLHNIEEKLVKEGGLKCK